MYLHLWGTRPRPGAPRRLGPRGRARPPRHRPSLEGLECRCVPSVAPLPLAGGFANPAGGPFVHLNLPGPADATPPNPPTSPQPTTNDPSAITDFAGTVGVAQVRGTGTGTDTTTGATSTLFFEVDLRFMQGAYVGVDGQVHQGTFALV
jgi:hypothetical protein